MTEFEQTDGISKSERSWSDLRESFAFLFAIDDKSRHEYELHKSAAIFKIPVDTYKNLYQNYCNSQVFERGSKTLALLKQAPLRAITNSFNILAKLGWLSLTGVAITLFLQLGEIWEREEYLAWAITIISQDNATSGGRYLALDTLKLIDSNLIGLNLQNAILPQINLSGANLFHSNFQDAVLIEANLTNANLSTTNLSGANLRQANFSESNLELTDFTMANLHRVNLDGAVVYRANFQKANLVDADFSQVKQLETATLYRAVYNSNTRFPEGFKPEESLAIRVDPGIDLSGLSFEGSNLMYVDMSDADLNNTNFQGALLHEADLTGADLSGANFSGAKDLTVDQVLAAHNWRLATFDEHIARHLAELQPSS